MTQTDTISTLDRERWHREATRATTIAMISKLEWAMLLYQFLGILTSALVDPYAGTWQRTTILFIALAHLPLAPYYFRYGGLTSRGSRWFWLPALQAVIIPMMAGLLTQPGLYGSHSCHTLCGYVPPMIVLYTMYVQVAVVSVGSRIAFESLILLIPLLWPFVMMFIMNSDPTQDNLIAVLSGQMQLVVAYLVGKAAVAMCRVSVARQVETQQQSFDQFFNFLHSHVKAGIAAVKAEQPNVSAMLDKLEEVEQTVSERRIEMLLMRDQIPLAVVISERTRAFTGHLQIMESPRVGLLTVAGSIGLLISRALGDLLKNVVEHGGSTVKINCSIEDRGQLSLTVTDDGAGFDPVVMDDPSKSLHRLRNDARNLGGDLIPRMTDAGTTMMLTLPLR